MECVFGGFTLFLVVYNVSGEFFQLVFSCFNVFNVFFRLSSCFEMLEIAPICSWLFYVVFFDLRAIFRWYSVVFGFSEVRKEMSALFAGAVRLSATTPQQPHHLIALQSGFEWLEFFGLLKLFQLFRLHEFVPVRFWLFLVVQVLLLLTLFQCFSVVLGCFRVLFGQKFDLPSRFKRFNLFVICATLSYVASSRFSVSMCEVVFWLC